MKREYFSTPFALITKSLSALTSFSCLYFSLKAYISLSPSHRLPSPLSPSYHGMTPAEYFRIYDQIFHPKHYKLEWDLRVLTSPPPSPLQHLLLEHEAERVRSTLAAALGVIKRTAQDVTDAAHKLGTEGAVVGYWEGTARALRG